MGRIWEWKGLAIRSALLGAMAFSSGCFVPTPEEDFFDVSAGEPCESDAACEDENPCTSNKCDAEAKVCVTANDDTLAPPPDNNECTDDKCEAGEAKYPNSPSGTTCGFDGALTCNGNGMCSGCAGDSTKCGEGSFCRQWTCPDNVCVPMDQPAGTALPDGQVSEDCKEDQCDGKGQVASAEDTNDAPADDGNACTREACEGTTPIAHEPQPGQACGQPAGCGNDAGSGASGTKAADTCDAAGDCIKADLTLCETGYLCVDATGMCATDCTGANEETNCDDGYTCQAGQCVPQLPLGSECTSGTQCESTNCMDGVCCDSPCADPCQFCNSSGYCNEIPDGIVDQCMNGQVCKDQGGFALDSICVDPASDQIVGESCGANGDCVNTNCVLNLCQLPDGAYCAAYPEWWCESNLCQDSVCLPCFSDANCATGICDIATGRCKLPNGPGCVQGADCASGTCDDGMCCNMDCSATCMACAFEFTGQPDGTCAFVEAGKDPYNDCIGAKNCMAGGVCEP